MIESDAMVPDSLEALSNKRVTITNSQMGFEMTTMFFDNIKAGKITLEDRNKAMQQKAKDNEHIR